ncbi:endolytic transglycosylase MltG [uncultured Amaricoccus sp.]|uniref:endolytic transglycosylase MltG n=1 Tax=uncultured Amaricoccus sp. TaxID=339341 RepID=UPI00260A4A9D|nr:endolytic transglycosylase MltG [uncultured Amaricoccus sp.]
MMRHVAANALTLLILALVLLFGVVTWVKSQVNGRGPLQAPLEFQVERGEGLGRVADRLAEAGAISNAGIFRIAARYGELDAGIRFGDYSIPAGASMREILELLNRGGNLVRQVVVPEGLTSWQVVELLKGRPELAGEVAEVPAEGTLAPAGYDFQRGEDRNALIARMEARQQEILAAAWAGRAPDLPLASPEELLTLASIVEKETGVAEERARVARVFVNRLERGMRLQTDPTVIYGITRGEGVLGRGLRASELAAATPYNTYARAGLPPGPIANPGAAAIEAAAHPAAGEELYFVADGTGGHAFAATLEEHNRNVAAWRRIEAQRAAEARAAEEAAAAAERAPAEVEGTPGQVERPMPRVPEP